MFRGYVTVQSGILRLIASIGNDVIFFCRARQIGAVATVADSACSFSELHRPSKSRPIGIVSWRVFDVELVEWGILEFILSSACWHIVRIFYE